MNVLQAIVLGIVQGLTEFLPVSSTAHVTLAGRAMGLIDPAHPESWTAFLAIVQLGTLAAVVAYFGRDLVRLASAAVRGLALRARGARLEDEASRVDERLAWLVVLGTIPIVIVGLALRDVIEGEFTKNLWVIAGSLVGLALFLALAERVGTRATHYEQISPMQALAVGASQVLALIPGASRSGTTIMGGLFAGLDRVAAARFSFILSVPAVAGSAVFELRHAFGTGGLDPALVLVAILAAAVSGYAAIWGLLRYLQDHNTFVFVGYRLALGALIMALLALRVITPL